MKPANASGPTRARVPVVEERATIGKKVEETGAVRVRVQTEEVRQARDLVSTAEEIEVQRVAVNAFVDERRSPWMEEGVTVVPIYEEVLVRRLLLKEEVRLVPRRSLENRPTTVSRRRDRVVIERRRPDGSWEAVDPAGPASPAGGMASKEHEAQDLELDVPPRDRSDT